MVRLFSFPSTPLEGDNLPTQNKISMLRTSTGAISKDWVPAVCALLESSVAPSEAVTSWTVTRLLQRVFGGNPYREAGRGRHGVIIVGTTSLLGDLALKIIKREGPYTDLEAPPSARDWHTLLPAKTCHTDPTELTAMRAVMRELVATDRCHNVVQFVAAIDVEGDDGRPCRAYVLRVADGDLDAWLCATKRTAKELHACLKQVLYAICTLSSSGILHNDLYGKNILFERTAEGFDSYEGTIGRLRLTLQTEGFFFSVADYGLATTQEDEHVSLSAECFPRNRLHAASLGTMPSSRHVLELEGLSPYARDPLAFLIDLRRSLPRSGIVKALLRELDRRNAKGSMTLVDLEAFVLWAMDAVDREVDEDLEI